MCDMFGRIVEKQQAVCAALSDHTVTIFTEAQMLELKTKIYPCAGNIKVNNYHMSKE